LLLIVREALLISVILALTGLGFDPWMRASIDQISRFLCILLKV
jgi:hypothetical protein